jgi:hypothetical protein
MQEEQSSPTWWPDLIRVAHEKLDGLTRIVTVNDPHQNYMLRIMHTGKKAVLYVNLAGRRSLDSMFSGNYAEAVFEHENAHFTTARTQDSYWEIDPANPLFPIRNDLRIRYYQFSSHLINMTRDSIANAMLEPKTLQQFLEFEVRKIGDRQLRLPFVLDNLLWLTEVKLCAYMRHLSVSDLEKNISAILEQNNVLQEIHVIAYDLFKKAWLASQERSQAVDLTMETRTLREYVLKHTPILLEAMPT